MDSLLITSGLTSFALGAAMTLFAWSTVRENRRREAARVVLLSGLAFPPGAPADVLANGPADGPTDVGRPFRAGKNSIPEEPPYTYQLASDEFLSERSTASESTSAPEPLFSEPAKSGAASRRTIALAAVCAVMTVGVGTFKWFSAASTNATSAPAAPATTASVTRPEPRVELLALDHATTPAGLVVTGRLRNPIDGASLHDIVAVVEVLDRTGRVLTTARAPIGRAVLNAGEWSDFSVAASKAANIARYRVEFHARERERVPQIDLRPAGPSSRSE
ncbi:MAG TPA: hypothetical protein VES67_02430 [Vicinamibacterales bacterium]|nr:hypothetical protein [Vicinamibacterales bacterium]